MKKRFLSLCFGLSVLFALCCSFFTQNVKSNNYSYALVENVNYTTLPVMSTNTSYCFEIYDSPYDEDLGDYDYDNTVFLGYYDTYAAYNLFDGYGVFDDEEHYDELNCSFSMQLTKVTDSNRSYYRFDSIMTGNVSDYGYRDTRANAVTGLIYYRDTGGSFVLQNPHSQLSGVKLRLFSVLDNYGVVQYTYYVMWVRSIESGHYVYTPTYYRDDEVVTELIYDNYRYGSKATSINLVVYFTANCDYFTQPNYYDYEYEHDEHYYQYSCVNYLHFDLNVAESNTHVPYIPYSFSTNYGGVYTDNNINLGVLHFIPQYYYYMGYSLVYENQSFVDSFYFPRYSVDNNFKRSDLYYDTWTGDENAIRQEAYNEGYYYGDKDGYDRGYDLGDDDGYLRGYNEGKSQGVAEGVASANNYSFIGMLGAAVDVPVKAITGLLNFDFLGVNMLAFMLGILSIGLILFLIRKLKGSSQ